MTEAGQIGLGVVLNGRGMESQLKGIAGMAAKTLGAVFAVKGLADFSRKCISLGSDLTEVQNVVDVTFGAMSSKVDKFASSSMTSFGLSEKVAKQFAGTYGAMAKSFGFDTKKTLEMSTALTGLAGDVASFYNISQDSAYTKLKSVFTGETEALKDLGVVMTQTALDQYALSNGFGKTTKNMSEAEKVSLRYAFVQEKLAGASGDFGRTQLGWANQTRIAALQGEAAMAQFGQGLINIFRPVLIWGNAVLAKVVQIATVFNKATSVLFGDAGGLDKSKEAAGGLADNMKNAATSGTALSEAAGKSGSGLDKAKKSAEKLMRTIAGFDRITKLDSKSSTGTSSVGSGIPSAITDTSGLDNLVSVSDKASGATEKLTGWLKELKGWVDKLDFGPLSKASGHVKDAFGELSDKISGGLAWGYENILKPLAKWTIEKGAPTALELFGSALDFVNGAIDVAKPGLDWLWKNFLAPLASWSGDELLSGMDWLSGRLESISDKLKDIKSVLNGEKSLKDMIMDWMLGARDTIPISKDLPTSKDAVADALFSGKTYSLDVNANLTSMTDGIKPKDKQVKDVKAEVADWMRGKSFSGTIPGMKAQLDSSKKGNSFSSTVNGMTASFSHQTKGKGFNSTVGSMMASFSKHSKGSGFNSTVGSMTAVLTKKSDSLPSSQKKLTGFQIVVNKLIAGTKAIASALGIPMKAGGGVLVNGKWRNVQQYASGGMPSTGQMFIARERGPELVGTIGGHSAVVNNGQIVASIEAAVERAMVRSLSSIANSSGHRPETIQLVLDGRVVTQVVRENLNRDTITRGSNGLLY